MARSYRCDLCQINDAVRLVGNVETGEQTFFCSACTVVDALGMLDQQLDASAKAVVIAKWAQDAGLTVVEAGAADDAPKSRQGGRRRARGGDGDQEPQGGQEPAPQAQEPADQEQPDSGLEKPAAAAHDG